MRFSGFAIVEQPIVPTITGINLSSTSFTGGSPSGTVVGIISVLVQNGTFTGTLTLSGTNAANFQIVGTSLETQGTVASGTYSINIVATQTGANGSPFTQLFSITGAGLSAPSQAASAGFTSLVFDTEFINTTDVATSSGQTTGAYWYWPSGLTPNFTINTGAGSGVTAGATGILTINSWTGTSFGPNFSTVPPNATSTVTTGVWNHGYFEARVQFGATVAGSGAPGGINEPSFWLKDARNLSAGTYYFAETDIMEYYPNGTAPNTARYISTLHNWHDVSGSYTDVFNSNTQNFDSSHQPGDGAWHTYGMLWTGNGTTGTVQFYFDNNLCTFSGGVTSFALNINGTPTAAFTAMENANMFLNISSASSGWPVNFDWIRVWQSSGSLTINTVTLNNTSFVGGAASGTVVGAITATMSSGSFTGTLAITGSNAGDFQLSSTTLPSNLETSGIIPSGTYSINIVATQGTATNSPFTQPFTITGTTATVNLIPSANATLTGATVGTVGSGGALPTGWSTFANGNATVTVTVVGFGANDGSGTPYIDVGLSWAAGSTTTSIGIYSAGNGTLPSISSSTAYVYSAYIDEKTVTTRPGGYAVTLAIEEYNGGTFVTQLTNSVSLTSTRTRFNVTGTTSSSTVTVCHTTMDVAFTAGQAGNIVWRIAGVQLETGTTPTGWVS